MTEFDPYRIEINPATTTRQIVNQLKQAVLQRLRRRGAVIGLSGGVDSAVVLALCVRAFGPERTLALLLPEQDSSPDSVSLAERVAAQFGVQTITETLDKALAGFGCYERRDEVIRRLFPEYGPGYGVRLVLPKPQNSLNLFSLELVAPTGSVKRKRLHPTDYWQIVAASNFKQRSRMAMLYYHAERLQYAVVGTANKDEYDQGFFVKYGDGGVDVKPIVHLYKTQVYQLAEYLDIPVEIRERTPTSDTYSAASPQDQFFFRWPFALMDPIWQAYEQGYPAGAVAPAMGLTKEQVETIYKTVEQRIRSTEYLRQPPLAVE